MADIASDLAPAQKLPGRAGKPKPEVIWELAQPALNTLASQWKERFDYIQTHTPGQDVVPPVMIVVCDNTDIAELFYRNISGETTVEEGPSPRPSLPVGERETENEEEGDGRDTSSSFSPWGRGRGWGTQT